VPPEPFQGAEYEDTGPGCPQTSIAETSLD
jgi:hypothetical protein